MVSLECLLLMINRIQIYFIMEFRSIETIGQLSSSPRTAARTAMKKVYEVQPRIYLDITRHKAQTTVFGEDSGDNTW